MEKSACPALLGLNVPSRKTTTDVSALCKSNLLSSAGLPACSSLQNLALVLRVKLVNLTVAPGSHLLWLPSSVQDVLPTFQVVKMSCRSPGPTVFVRDDFQSELIWDGAVFASQWGKLACFNIRPMTKSLSPTVNLVMISYQCNLQAWGYPCLSLSLWSQEKSVLAKIDSARGQARPPLQVFADTNFLWDHYGIWCIHLTATIAFGNHC